jgi:hypothetical protein
MIDTHAMLSGAKVPTIAIDQKFGQTEEFRDQFLDVRQTASVRRKRKRTSNRIEQAISVIEFATAK